MLLIGNLCYVCFVLFVCYFVFLKYEILALYIITVVEVHEEVCDFNNKTKLF